MTMCAVTCAIDPSGRFSIGAVALVDARCGIAAASWLRSALRVAS